MIRSILGRILISHVAVIVVVTLTMGMLMSFLIRNYMVENRRVELIQKGLGAAALLSPFLQAGRIPNHLENISNLLGATAWLADNSGNVLAGKAPERWSRRFPEKADELAAIFNGNVQSWVRTGRNQADPSVVVAIPVLNTSPPVALFLYTPILGINKAAQAVETLLLYSLTAGVAVALLLALFISRSLTKPIENIIGSADRFARGDFTARTIADGRDEIGRLGRTFNSMADSLAAVEQNRREFLATVSHELKTPVASIQALAESLADGMVTDPAQQQRYLKNIVSETGRIDRLIKDLLDLSRIEAGEIRIHREDLNLETFVRNYLESLTHLFRSKNLRINLESSTVPLTVTTDIDRLGQVFTNVLANAARYAPEGSEITISLRPSGLNAILSVTDQGPGIPASDLPHIFERFYRVEKSRTRADGGTGLGLAICKKLMDAMGGDIQVESREGHGTTFYIILPVNKKFLNW